LVFFFFRIHHVTSIGRADLPENCRNFLSDFVLNEIVPRNLKWYDSTVIVEGWTKIFNNLRREYKTAYLAGEKMCLLKIDARERAAAGQAPAIAEVVVKRSKKAVAEEGEGDEEAEDED
jgi:hypothetical protein